MACKKRKDIHQHTERKYMEDGKHENSGNVRKESPHRHIGVVAKFVFPPEQKIEFAILTAKGADNLLIPMLIPMHPLQDCGCKHLNDRNMIRTLFGKHPRIFVF